MSDNVNFINTLDTVNYEDVFIPEYVNQNPFPGQDNYEYNDNYEDAVKLCPDEFYNLNEYQSLLNATLYYDYLTPDYDYYYFTIFTDSYVEIQLNTTSLDCEFSLTYFDYLISSDDNNFYNASNLFSTVRNNDNQDSYNNFIGVLKPGTYIIYLDNLFDYSIVTSYQLMLDVVKTDDSADVYINDLIYNKNCMGAIWMNDYIPFNFYPNLSCLSDVLYYQFGKQNLNYLDYSLEKLSSLVEDSALNSCTIYIWDPVLRMTLYETLVTIADILHNELINYDKISFDLQLIHDSANNTINILGLINDFVPIKKTFKVAISNSLDALATALDVIFQILMPKFDLEKTEYFTYINSLITSLDMQFNEGDILPDVETLRSINALEIIQIPIFYTFDIQKNSCKISYKKTIDYHNENHSFLYNDDIIYANQCGFPFLRGKVYAINRFDDFFDMDSLTLCSDMISDHNEITLYEEVSIGSLYDKEYVWLQFIPEDTKCYYILCYGDENVKIDIFDYKSKSYVDRNRLYSFVGGYTNVNDSSKVGCYANVVLQEGITYYFRISGDGYSETDELIFLISDNPRDDAAHVHNYNNFIWISPTQHKSFCECGESIICGHAILNNNIYCELCRGRADIGFVGPFT